MIRLHGIPDNTFESEEEEEEEGEKKEEDKEGDSGKAWWRLGIKLALSMRFLQYWNIFK